MSALFALVERERDLADICFLIALVLFLVAAVLRFLARAIDTALVAAGLAAAVLGLLLL